MKKILKYALLSAIALAAPVANAENLVILHTNDTHSQIDPFADDDLGGVARRKVVIDSVRAEHENVLLIDAGDIVQGTLFFNLYRGEVEEQVMNLLGYDIRILGNHEFDNGMQTLADNLKRSNAELLCVNYDMRETPLDGIFKPYTIKEYGGKRIAIMGINLEPEGMISADNYAGMGYIDAIEAANHTAWWLKNMEHADMVIAVTHIGYEPSNGPGDVKLAKLSDDIDVIIGGHSHTFVDPSNPATPNLIANADGRQVLVSQEGKGGRYVGELVIDLDNIGATPQHKSIRIDSRLDGRTDPAVEEMLKPYRAEVDALNRKMVGRSAKHLDKDSQELLNFVSDYVLHRGSELMPEVDFAILNKGGIRNSLPKGNISEGNIITMLPFFNRVQVADISGADLIPVFDQMAKTDGNGVSANVSAVYDPDSDKCISVTIDGKPLDPDKTYRLASIDYLMMGGDYMTSLKNGRVLASSPQILFDDILDYFRNTLKNKKINPSGEVRMKPVK